MSKEGVFSRYVCDRPAAAHEGGKEAREYIREGDVKENNWHQVVWTDSNGAVFKYWLCRECYEKYLSVAQQLDQQVTAFMGEGA